MFRRKQAHRRAFSMLELTMVVAIMGILMTVAVVAFGGKIFAAKETTTRTTLRTIKNELEAYKVKNGTYPPTLDALVPAYLEKLPIDGWKQKIAYSPRGVGNRPFELISAGEDMKHETEDDISVWDDEGSTR